MNLEGETWNLQASLDSTKKLQGLFLPSIFHIHQRTRADGLVYLTLLTAFLSCVLSTTVIISIISVTTGGISLLSPWNRSALTFSSAEWIPEEEDNFNFGAI